MSALRRLRVGAPTRRIGVSPVSDLARRRASLPTDAGRVDPLVPNLGARNQFCCVFNHLSRASTVSVLFDHASFG